MTIPASAKTYWESRFPELSGKWTHWRLSGDGTPIAVFAGDKLLEALRFVEAKCLDYSSIACQLAIADETGHCSRIDELVVEISNIDKQQLSEQ
jgi:hypothetical protein